MGGDNGILGLLESPSRHHNLFIYATENKSPNNGDVIRANVVSPEPPTQSPIHDQVYLQSSSDEDTLSTTQSPEKTNTAPEPPRWRFINDAKKSLGYSSIYAGSYIKGQSNEDLGAKYIAPDISLYSPKKENIQPKKVEYQLRTVSDSPNKEDVEVGKLDSNTLPQSEWDDDNCDQVGKLQTNSSSSAIDSAEASSRQFHGLPKTNINNSASTKSFKEWSIAYQVGLKNGERDHVHDTTNDSYSYTMPGNKSPDQKSVDGVGRLKFHSSGTINEEKYNVGCMKNEVDYQDERGNCTKSECSEDIKGVLFISDNDASTNDNNVEGTSESDNNDIESSSTLLTEQNSDKDLDSRRKKHRWMYLALLILLILVVILGVLLGKNNNKDAPTYSTAAEGVLVPPVALIVNDTTEVPSSQPSFQPSTSPSKECQTGTIPFTIMKTEAHTTTSTNYVTWRIKDACTGEAITQCYPCSQYDEPVRRHLNENLYTASITECLPTNTEYALEILSIKDAELCCGFDATSAVILYDDNVIRHYGTSDNIEPVNITYFGERDSPCASDIPSTSPTVTASEWPSHIPSQLPSTAPTFSPSNTPTTSPSLNPTTLEPSTFPTSQPTSQPSAIPTTAPNEAPTLNPITALPTLDPSIAPNEAPTILPTLDPSNPPCPKGGTISSEPKPSYRPTSQTVCSTEQDFNLCLAVDMSGSVCNNGDGSDCEECIGPTLFGIPIFFLFDCRDSFVSEDTCCGNFANIKDFASTMVELLGDFQATKSFSVVQFATDAQIINTLDSPEQTVRVIERLDYTGGLTNHASAIQACQQTLPPSSDTDSSSKKNFIMLVTDGVPTEPGLDPEGAAEFAASTAKSEDTFIIPVFISPFYDESALAFMRRLSSDGKVFDVTDFASLNSLQDSLVDQVSCS